jgi:hypothetical protein
MLEALLSYWPSTWVMPCLTRISHEEHQTEGENKVISGDFTGNETQREITGFP